MLVSAISSATISYHSYFKVQASLLMCQLYPQMTTDSIENTDIDSQNCFHNIGMLALHQVALLFKLAT